MMEVKTIPTDSKLKIGDIILFMASQLEEGKEITTKATGSAIISDYHKEDDVYNIILWDYKEVPKSTTGKGAILDIKEVGGPVIATENGMYKPRCFVVLGGLHDQNLIDFMTELKEDLGKGSENKPVFLVIREVKETNVIEMMKNKESN